jgi:glutamine---fructose-6-phosphate transaminase (isomerizing)
VAQLPDALDASRQLDWWPALAPLAQGTSVYVLGRGIGLAAALEIALKLKETCRLHAEAFSTALHRLARARRLDPDAPAHLTKVTETQ